MSAPDPVTRITDPNDPAIEEYRAVRDRDLQGSDTRPGRFIGEGMLILEVMLENPGMTRSVLVSEARADRVMELVRDSKSPGTDLLVASSEVMNEIVGFDIHRGVIASGNRPDESDRTLEKILPRSSEPATILVCDGINNIDNIGLLFRNAAAFGVDAVILSPDCHDPLYRKSIRVSIGHALRIPFHRSSNWKRTLEELKTVHGIELIGTSIGPDAGNIETIPAPDRVGLVMGGEFDGLGRESIDACSHLARIPMTPGTDSLNVGVAAAVFLHRFSRADRA
ncbi:MAG: RNA methyltransferase [Phycisphaerales bacterium]|nr:RNA methyltransferase [Phycisphaerales bacterium]